MVLSRAPTFSPTTAYEYTFQNTTFIVEEILLNMDPNGILPPSIAIQPDGTMVYQTSTEPRVAYVAVDCQQKILGKIIFFQ